MNTREKKAVIQQIRDVWGSLDTHLDHTYGSKEAAFHAKTSVEYAEQIIRLVKLL